VSHIEASLCTERYGSNQGLGTIDGFIVRVPSKVVTAISVVVDKNSIKCVSCVLFALTTDVSE
jgi:hypothetical protein